MFFKINYKFIKVYDIISWLGNITKEDKRGYFSPSWVE